MKLTLILLSIIIYVIASLLIVNKKKHYPIACVLETVFALMFMFLTKETWCTIMSVVALVVVAIMTIMIVKANKEI